MDLKKYANMFKAICACELLEMVNCNQFTSSHHMKILCDAEIVEGRKEGKWVHYSVHQEGARRAQLLLKQYLTVHEEE